MDVRRYWMALASGRSSLAFFDASWLATITSDALSWASGVGGPRMYSSTASLFCFAISCVAPAAPSGLSSSVLVSAIPAISSLMCLVMITHPVSLTADLSSAAVADVDGGPFSLFDLA